MDSAIQSLPFDTSVGGQRRVPWSSLWDRSSLLHGRFVDTVTQIGGPDKSTPKTVMGTMRLKCLTICQFKSHFQSALSQDTGSSSTPFIENGVMAAPNERIEAKGKYLKAILEKALDEKTTSFFWARGLKEKSSQSGVKEQTVMFETTQDGDAIFV
ncbi:PREDICTED: protein PHR1-LIKE 3-like [Tarenaya hassleriana]|uniref:protein PHR1-LIKE 3-like n=1 Tax=Tarenaya hassleriana TaxID=28532 RepID=UPI00053C53FF|nr:PREDICTED: protein PHR1-LIKE 3-like [Tarenaya hassleriana]